MRIAQRVMRQLQGLVKKPAAAALKVNSQGLAPQAASQLTQAASGRGPGLKLLRSAPEAKALLPRPPQALKALPAAEAAVGLLPPARPPGPRRQQSPAMKAAWARHHGALNQAYQKGALRHNRAVDGLQKAVSQGADAPWMHRLAAGLSDGARWGEKGFDVVVMGAKLVQDMVEKRPKVEDIQRAFKAVQADPNAFRHWVKGLPKQLPRF